MKGISGTFTKGWWSSDQRSSTLGSLCSFCLSHTIRSRKHNSTIPVSSLPFLELKLQSAQPGSDIAQRVIPYVMPDTLKVGPKHHRNTKTHHITRTLRRGFALLVAQLLGTAIFGGLLGWVVWSFKSSCLGKPVLLVEKIFLRKARLSLIVRGASFKTHQHISQQPNMNCCFQTGPTRTQL